MKYINILPLITLLLLSGCIKDEIETYSGDNYVYFARSGEDVLEYSFSFHPGREQDTIPLAVKLIGQIADRDRIIDIEVDPAKTTALPADYLLPSNIVFKAGKASDTIPLVLFKTDKLLQTKLKLGLIIKEGADFKCGPVTNVTLDILFSDMLSKPEWWDESIVNNFLGIYSDAKYRYFIEATGISDMSKLNESEKRAYAQIFRDFLKRGREQGRVFNDEQGNPITVPEGLFS
jgi:hypothetical protein